MFTTIISALLSQFYFILQSLKPLLIHGGNGGLGISGQGLALGVIRITLVFIGHGGSTSLDTLYISSRKQMFLWEVETGTRSMVANVLVNG